MDFDFHFGRFFGSKIDVFEKLLLPDFEFQLEVRSAKIVVLPRETNEMATNEKYKKNWKNIASKSSCFFTLIFLGF